MVSKVRNVRLGVFSGGGCQHPNTIVIIHQVCLCMSVSHPDPPTFRFTIAKIPSRLRLTTSPDVKPASNVKHTRTAQRETPTSSNSVTGIGVAARAGPTTLRADPPVFSAANSVLKGATGSVWGVI